MLDNDLDFALASSVILDKKLILDSCCWILSGSLVGSWSARSLSFDVVLDLVALTLVSSAFRNFVMNSVF